MQEFGLLSTIELLCATFAIKSSLLEESLGLERAALGGVCSSIVETALAWWWELRLAVQLLLVGEYCLGLNQVWVDTDLSHLKHSLGVSSMTGQARDLKDEWEVKLLTDVEELNVAAAATPANARGIEGKIKKVEITFKRLQIVYRKWGKKIMPPGVMSILLRRHERTDVIGPQEVGEELQHHAGGHTCPIAQHQ